MTIQHDTGMPATGGTGGDQSKTARVTDTATTEASNVASTAAEGAREVAGEASAEVKAVAGETKRQFDQLVGQTRDEVRQQAEQRNTQAASRLRSLADQVNALAQGRAEEAGPLVGYLNDAESQIQSLASRLEQRGPEGVLDDVKSFARRRSGLFLAAALGAGFLVGRAARSAAANKSEEGESGLAYTGYQPVATDPLYTGAMDTGPMADPLGAGNTGPIADPLGGPDLPPPVLPDRGAQP